MSSHANQYTRLTVAGVVLAAGLSTRWGPGNKLLEPVEGIPMVRRVTEAALEARLGPVVVVTGHDAGRVSRVLGSLTVELVHNPEYELGLSTSLRTGMEALPPRVDAVAILLGDMPGVRPEHLRALVDAWEAAGPDTICVPSYRDRRGNPVIWPSRFFSRLRSMEGDRGARVLMAELADWVREVPMEDPGVVEDVDTRDGLDPWVGDHPS